VRDAVEQKALGKTDWASVENALKKTADVLDRAADRLVR